MNCVVHETHSLTGQIKAPPSKSYTHRAIIIGSMSGNATVINPSLCEDTLKTMEVWRKLGSVIELDEKNNCLDIKGFNGQPHLDVNAKFDVGESKSLLTFALPIIALGKGQFQVVGRGTLKNRPNREIVEALQNWGVKIEGQSPEQTLPILINALGEVRGGHVNIQDARSSQFVSALLIVAPFAQKNTTITVDTKLVSRPYVDITIDVLKWAGVKVEVSEDGGRECFHVRKGQQLEPKEPFMIHGDYSGAASLMAASVLLKSDVTITDLLEDCQGDGAIIGILERMGAQIKRSHDRVRITGPCELHGVDIDCGNTPDLVPALVTLGCFACGETRILNVAHLARKESNRIHEPAMQLKKLGADISWTDDSITVRHSELKTGRVASRGDHRIAMSLAIAALRIRDGLLIEGCECISKSYPNFLSDLKSIGVQIEPDDCTIPS